MVGSEDPKNANCRLILRVDIAAFLHLCLLNTVCLLFTLWNLYTWRNNNTDYSRPISVARNKSKLFAIYNTINVVYLAKNVKL